MALIKLLNYQTCTGTNIIGGTGYTDPYISLDGGTTAAMFINVTADTFGTRGFTAANTSADNDTMQSLNHGLSVGNFGQLTTTGTLPSPLALGTTYYVVPVDVNWFRLATSLANAQAGTYINLTDQGSGTHTLTGMSSQFAASAVDTTADTITITAHGYTTGIGGQLTTTSGLPSPLVTSTNYYVIVVDANTIQLATSVANALNGTAIDLTTQGAGTDTFTPTNISINVVRYFSADPPNTVPTNWMLSNISNITFSSVVSSTYNLNYANFMKTVYFCETGRAQITTSYCVRGPN